MYENNTNFFANSKQKELKSWEDNNVYNLLKNENQKCISLHWVLTSKESPEGYIPKARLVAHGFVEDCLQNIDKDLPTCSKDSLQVFFAAAAQNDWCLKSIDIKTAFLKGNLLNRDAFIQPPPKAKCPQNCIWKMNKCVYGLCDASLKWYSRILKSDAENDGTVSFYVAQKNKLTGIIGIHVENFLCAGEESFISSIRSKLNESFLLGKEVKYFCFL